MVTNAEETLNLQRKMFFRPSEIFAVNKQLSLFKETVGSEGHEILVIDDFYQDPHRVRQLFLESPAAIWKTEKGSRNFIDYFDCRQSIQMQYDYQHLPEVIEKIIYQEFGIAIRYPNSANTNIFQLIKEQPPGTSAFPHTDASPYAESNVPVNTLIYLNTPEECYGGTALYRHKKSGRESIPLEENAYKEFCDKYTSPEGDLENWNYWCPYEKDWEKFHLIEMKFNRLIVFPSEIFHGAWHEPGWFKNYPRINQVFFPY